MHNVKPISDPTLPVEQVTVMFESQYNDEMEAEVMRLEAQKRASDVGHPEWENACRVCGCRINGTRVATCTKCAEGS